MSAALENVLSRLERVKRNGSGYMAQCPAHEDRNPSLAISEGDDGRVLVHCHAGCETVAILAAAGLTDADLFDRNGVERSTIVATYDYVDEDGGLLFQVVRFAPKDFRQRRPDGSGDWIWNLRGVRRALYRLPRVLQAVASGEYVYVVEGEKDVEALERAGVVATCSPMGAGKWQPEYAEVLRGADVVIVPDRDAEGYAHARTIAASLEGVARTIEIRLPAEGKDAADHLAAGLGLGDFEEATVDALYPEPAAAEAITPELRIVTGEAFADVDEPGSRAILGDAGEAVIPEGGDVMIYGDGGVGKTTLATDLGCHLAAGDSWLGIGALAAVRVLIVENEGPRPLFRRKLHAKLEGWAGAPLGGRLLLLEEPWAEFTFALVEHRAALAQAIAEHEIDVVIVGPVTASGMLEAGTIQEVRDFVKLLAAVRVLCGRRVTFVLVHHENKGGSVSGAWEGVGETLVHVQGEGNGRTRLYFQKVRWASSWHQKTLHLVWTDGEGFAVIDGQEAREGRREAELEEATAWIVEFVTAHPGSARSAVEGAFHEAHGGGRNTARRAITRQLEELARWRDTGESSPRLATTTGQSPSGIYLIPFADADSPLAAALFGADGDGVSDPEPGGLLAASPPARRAARQAASKADGVENAVRA